MISTQYARLDPRLPAYCLPLPWGFSFDVRRSMFDVRRSTFDVRRPACHSFSDGWFDVQSSIPYSQFPIPQPHPIPTIALTARSAFSRISAGTVTSYFFSSRDRRTFFRVIFFMSEQTTKSEAG